ncbi:MAG: helix-turn-helix transcriptional regulator [Clostridiales bacterium]|nr:helix-turn-helix transcriptional regulator [Clostridiales bacterium]
MQFNEKLKKLRGEKGVSQSELAESIYVSRSAVAKWENGLGLPSNESLRLLCEYFDVSKEDLYSDAPTEKVIVQKNKIISRSRKLLITISTVCAVAFTAVIVLAVVLGLKSAAKDELKYPLIDGVRGSLYSGANYDRDEDCWTTSPDKWNYISSTRDVVISANELHWETYTLTVGEYALRVVPSPHGYNGRQFAIHADCVGIKYNSDVFDIVRTVKFIEYDPVYLIIAKKPCKNEEILLYKVELGAGITENSKPSEKLIITVLPSEEAA